MAFRSSSQSPYPTPKSGRVFKIWKANPPGPEQKELDRMFAEKEIDPTMSANTVKNGVAMFKEFPATVFANHFRITKAKYGFAAALPKQNGSIPELGSTNKNIAKSAAGSEWEENHYGDDFPPDEQTISFVDPPCSTWTYTDFERKVDVVCVAVPIIAGSQDVDFTLSTDGTQVEISYTWPKAVYDPMVLFEEELRKRTLSLTHPNVHSFCKEMVEKGYSTKSAPKGSIVVKLPCKVMREESSWKKAAKTIGVTRVAFLTFTAFQKQIFIEEADTSLKF